MKDLSLKLYFKIFDTKIIPILLYGAEIWGMKINDQLEKVHLYACKKYLGVKNNTPTVMIYGETGRYPLYIQAYVKIIKYWLRLLRMNTDRYPRKCYDMMKLYDSTGKRNWVTSVRELLFNIGFNYVWYNQCVESEPLFIMSFTQRLKDVYIQKWLENLSSSNKCLYYRMLKNNIETEPYLHKLEFRRFRIALARFRCSSHNLLIETGRYNRTNRNERICTLCNLNVIEDEFHFLLECHAFKRLRDKYLPSYYCLYPNVHKFIALLTSSSDYILCNIASYVYHAMLLRNTIVHSHDSV